MVSLGGALKEFFKLSRATYIRHNVRVLICLAPRWIDGICRMLSVRLLSWAAYIPHIKHKHASFVSCMQLFFTVVVYAYSNVGLAHIPSDMTSEGLKYSADDVSARIDVRRSSKNLGVLLCDTRWPYYC
jgi:hypothetical protein